MGVQSAFEKPGCSTPLETAKIDNKHKSSEFDSMRFFVQKSVGNSMFFLIRFGSFLEGIASLLFFE